MGWLGTAGRRERVILGAAMLVSAILVIVYVIAVYPHALVGDQREYHAEGILFTEGNPWWSETLFGVPHPSAWKAPLYPLWVGAWYELLGPNPASLAAVQALLAPLTVLLSWMLARRLFDRRVALLSAWAVALFPFVWEFYGLLYPEAIAIPLTLGVLLLFLGRDAPSGSRAALVGAALGALILVRPTSVFLLAGMLAAWVVAAGWRRGVATSAIAGLAAVLVIAPWTIRNVLTDDVGFVPISVQDAAAYGTFNEVAANDPVYPYAWRPYADEVRDVLFGPRVPEAELRSELQAAALSYIAAHPFSPIEAFLWNGVSRLWDLRNPERALDEVPFEGRSRIVTAIGLGIYYLLLAAAIFGLWRQRTRREIVIPILAIAAAASVVFTTASGTRYRATLEPLLVIAAASVLAPARARATVPEVTPTRSSPAASS